MKISAVIPAYNEGTNIVTLCQRLHQTLAGLRIPHEILVVVQGQDGSFEALQQLQRATIPQLRLLHFRQPLGVAKAFQRGFVRMAPDATHVLTMDADLNHQPEELPRLLEALGKGADIVIGSRYIAGGLVLGMPRVKLALSRLMNQLFLHLTPLRVADKTSGYRVQRRAVVDHVGPHIRAKNFDFYIEYLILAREAGYRMCEVPITFQVRVAGRSKMKIIDTCYRYVRLILWSLVHRSRLSPAESADVTAPAQCVICGSPDYAIIYPPRRAPGLPDMRCTSLSHTSRGQIVQCHSCSFRYVYPRPPAETVHALYEQTEDPTYLAEASGREQTFARALDFVHAYRRPGGQLLDVGCYAGIFLDAARHAGWDTAGVEPSQWAARIAQRKGHQIHVGIVDAAASFQHPFDVITLWDVLEHLTNPRAALTQLHAILPAGGYLFLSTVDVQSMWARVLGARWPWYMDMHLFYFDRQNLTRLLVDTGFRVVAIRPYVHVVSWRYLAYKLRAYVPWLASGMQSCLRAMRLDNQCIPVDCGDFVMVAAQKVGPEMTGQSHP